MMAQQREEAVTHIRIDTSSPTVVFKEFDRLELMAVRDNIRDIWVNLTFYIPGLHLYVQEAFQDKELQKELHLTYFDRACRMNWPTETEQEEIIWQIRSLIAMLCVLAGTTVTLKLLQKSVYGTVRGMINPTARVALIDRQPVNAKFQTEAVGNVFMAVAYATYPSKPIQGLAELFTQIELTHVQQTDIVRGALALLDKQVIVFN